jgi:4-hydroxythreonine-4-phosphate dehydrogenase
MTKRLALTCGDPAGVGPEIIASWLGEYAGLAPGVAVIGPARWLASLPLNGAQAIAVGDEAFVAKPGEPSREGARAALAAMERAAEGTKRGEFSGVVTGPVSKSWLQKAGYAFPGQTEFFAAKWGGEPTMAFCGGKLRVVLLTWHIPLRDVAAQLTPGNLSRAVRAADELARAEGVVAPRIGVCGLNPHAGEGGLLGAEEREIIDPVLDGLRAEFPGLSRCEPGDTLFARALRGEFDVVIALYHDQGLAPLKTVDFDEAVNVTLGLPHVRTSPDHGTAFGIAGRGVASARSFSNAVTVAQRLIKARGGR